MRHKLKQLVKINTIQDLQQLTLVITTFLAVIVTLYMGLVRVT